MTDDSPSGPPKAYRWRVVDAVEASDLPPVARHLMVTLCGRLSGRGMHTGELGEYSPSLSLLATITGWKPSAVKDHLCALDRLGWLIRVQPPVKLQRSEKARTSYTVRIPGEPPDLSVLSRPPHGLEGDTARPPHGLELGRHTATARPPHGHASDSQTNQTGATAPDGRKPSGRRAAAAAPRSRPTGPRCPNNWPIAADGYCCPQCDRATPQRST